MLALHGAADPFVPPAEVAAFEKEMTDAKVDWKLVPFEGAVHAFTNPAAGNDPTKGAAYDAKADKASWEAATAFFAERFAGGPGASAGADGAGDATKAIETLSKAFADARAAGDAEKVLELTKALLPTDAEVRSVLKAGPETDAFVTAYRAERLRGDANEAAKEILKPNDPAQTVVQVHSATTEEIVAYAEGSVAAKEFPGGMKVFAAKVAGPGRIWHVIEYLEPGKDAGMKFSVLTVVGRRVLFLLKPWRALPR